MVYMLVTFADGRSEERWFTEDEFKDLNLPSPDNTIKHDPVDGL